MNTWVSTDNLDFVKLQDGRYYNAYGKRNPFSQEYLMVVKKIRNGLVNPITEQYISEISYICLEPIDVPWEVEE